MRWTAPPGSTHITVYLSKNGATKSQWMQPPGSWAVVTLTTHQTGTCVVTGLDGGAWYDAHITASNDFGWGSVLAREQAARS